MALRYGYQVFLQLPVGGGRRNIPRFLVEQTIHVILGVKHHKVVDLLAYSNITDGKVQFLRDRDGDAAFCCAVEFRQDDASDVGNLGELASLFEAILARDGVDDKKGFVWSPLHLA